MSDGVLPPAGTSPLVGRYLARNWKLRLLMTVSDVVFAPLRLRRAATRRELKRVLVSINGHLGDAVIATSALRLLADALPDAEIGVLLPSWSGVVLEGHPAVSHFHSVDHWHTSRSGGALHRWRAYRRSRRRAIREIRRVGYDAAVDLYDYFPNAALLLWRAGIPIRIGFNAAGFSAFYSHSLQWPDDDSHTAERHLILLRALLPASVALETARVELTVPPAAVLRRVNESLQRHGLRPGSFTVIHPGAGSPAKELSIDRWRALAERAIAAGETVVFTGRGEREHERVRRLVHALPRAIDFCDALDWHEFVHVIRLADRLISVDSVAGHVAAAVGTPSVTIWTSSSSPHHWRPLAATSVVVDPQWRGATPAPTRSAIS